MARKRHKKTSGQRSAAPVPTPDVALPEVSRELNYRTIALRLDAQGRPGSLDEAARSVEAIGASENPVTEFDWERFEWVPTVLLMSGAQVPASRQVVLLDTHRRGGDGNGGRQLPQHRRRRG